VKFRPLFAAIVLILLLSPQASRAQDDLPRMEDAPCEFDTGGLDVTCANLLVPEDRTNPNSPTIRLRFAIFPAWGDDKQPDPILYLEGGPGADALAAMPMLYYGVAAPFNETRDVILIDQRGTGYSRPSLTCPEYDNTLYEMLDERLTVEDTQARILAALAQCRLRLESRGVNLAAYNSAESAADIADLRRVLGYEQWNLYGISYGTRLALTVMRDYPDGIRSVVLDSVQPPEVSQFNDTPANVDRALNVLFLDCTLDEACNARYPRLGSVFYETVAQLNAQPGAARINHPTTRREYTVQIDGDQLVSLAFGALYTPQLFRALPQIIYDARDGNYSLLANTLQSLLANQEGISIGMHFAVQCREEAPFASAESVSASIAAFPLMGNYFFTEANLGTTILSVCAAWGLPPPAPIETMPVVSPIPTFVAAGQYDPITPPHWSRMVAHNLPFSYYYEYRGLGHAVTPADVCPSMMMLAFVDNPMSAPDASCMATMPAPDFIIVDDTLEMIPFADEYSGVRSVRPEAWQDYGNEFYRSEMQDAGLIFGSLDLADLTAAPTEDIIDYFVREIAAQYDVYDTPQPIEQRRANGLAWDIFAFRQGDNVVTIALADSDTTIYWVILFAPAAERDTLYTGAFLPAVDALRAY
jgi:pimeloyl-ACP methyl ester carboxylesterase